jgi:hypothetical protein
MNPRILLWLLPFVACNPGCLCTLLDPVVDPDPPPPYDSGTPYYPWDTGRWPRDTGTWPQDTGRPVPTDGGTSLAGQHCDERTPCGTSGILQCETSVPFGFCTAQCTNSTSQANERMQCDGPGSTCLTQGDPDPSDPTASSSLCTHACSPSATMSGCLPGQVCTGWWYTHNQGRPDTTGCFPFCGLDAHCPMGQMCNPRVGECGTGVVMTRKPDGSPCTPRNGSTECRGICFRVDDAGHGICGSFINTRDSRTCADDAEHLQILAPSDSSMRSTDNLGLCIFKTCECDRDCTGGTGYVCVTSPMAEGHTCGWPDTTMGEHSTPCPVTDAGTPDSGPADTGVAPTDTGTAPVDSGTTTTDASTG